MYCYNYCITPPGRVSHPDRNLRITSLLNNLQVDGMSDESWKKYVRKYEVIYTL